MSKMISSRTIQVDKVQTSREEVCQRLSKILFGYRLVMVTVITVVIMPILCGSCGSSLRTSGNSEDAKTLYNKGLESYRSDDMPAAIEAWSQALSIYKTISGTERDQAICHKDIGAALRMIGKYEEAIARQKQALRIFKTIKGTKWEQAACYKNIGVALINMSKYEDAIAMQEQALAIYKKIKDTERNQAGCYVNIGEALRYMAQYEDAIARQEQALSIYKTIKGTELEQGDCYLNIGPSLRNMGKYEEAIAKEKQALAIYKTIKGTKRNQAHCYMNIGVALDDMSKYVDALTRYEQALSIYEMIRGTDREQAACYKNIGLAFENMGKYEEAEARYGQALLIYKTIMGTERDQAECYKNIGIVLRHMANYQEAAAQEEQALTIYKTIKGTEWKQAGCLVNIGVALWYMAKYEECITQQEQALRIYKKIKGTERDQATCYKNIGVALDDMGKYVEAIAKQEQALRLYKTIEGTELNQAGCYMNIGNAIRKMNKYEEAIAKQEQALAIYKTIGGTERDQAGCYKNIGLALWKMSKYEEGIVKQKQALAIYKTIEGTERDQADCYMNIGVALDKMGKYEEAIAKQEEALAIYKTTNHTERMRATCHMNIGAALIHLDKNKEAITQQEQALEIYKTIKGTDRDQATCYRNIGVAFRCMSKYEEAITRQEQALEIYKTIEGTEREQAACYTNIGLALWNIAKYEDCIAKQKQALEIYKTIKGTEHDQADCYVNIGIAFNHIGKYEEAITQQEQALSIFKTIKGTEREQATCHRNIGVALGEMAMYEEAIVKQEQAIAIYKKIKGTERDQGACYGNIGWSHLRAGQYSRAIASFNHSGSSWWVWRGLGKAYRLRGEPGNDQKAVQLLRQAMERTEQIRASVMAFEHRAGIFEEPAQVFPDFVSLLVDLSENKAKIEHPEVLSWSMDPESDAALLEAAFHFVDRGKGRAMEDALREKATLKATHPDTNLLVKDKELSLQISKLASLRDELSETEIGRRERFTKQINELQQQRNMLEVELKRTALGGYVAPEFRKPMEMAKELPSQTAVLQYSVGEKESWLLILTRGGVTAHRLGAETSTLPELLPRQEATLGQLTQEWKERPRKIGIDGLVRLARIRAEDLSKKPRERHNLIDANQERAILERLGEVALPGSALAELRGKEIRHLLVIPDGSLHYVPFAMLRVEGDTGASKQYLVEQYSVSYTPAMTTLETIRKQAQERQRKRKLQRRSLLAFANPSFKEAVLPSSDDMVTRVRTFRSGYYRDSGLRLTVLPETEQEAVRAGSLFAPPKVYKSPISEVPEAQVVVCVSRAASEEQVKRLLGLSSKARWRYLLFSTHGLADTHNGMLSCIALSSPLSDSTEDGFLQAQEVMDLELDADLVMLSACQTGLGRMRSGEGLVGLSSAFFYAGAESVCASLWQVPSEPTGQLVMEFFKRLREGTDKTEALRRAQLAVMHQGVYQKDKSISYSDPFCWAAFVLTGEWK